MSDMHGMDIECLHVVKVPNFMNKDKQKHSPLFGQ